MNEDSSVEVVTEKIKEIGKLSDKLEACKSGNNKL